MKIETLMWLLNEANTFHKHALKGEFYALKEKILRRYAEHDGYDLQFIEGLICHTCKGSGKLVKENLNDNEIPVIENCYHCTDGLYKQPQYVYLERRKSHGYIFHIPIHRVHEKPPIEPNIFGYIEHEISMKADIAYEVLMLLNRKGIDIDNDFEERLPF